ncbi:hypothetical protein [Phycicoccus sp. DTK01]|nr:hypothetical protein [Phycicoccus sp. DTK01]GIL36429.1 hypothetical protein PDTK01_25040 [Phycicoccus sp. DTK01]
MTVRQGLAWVLYVGVVLPLLLRPARRAAGQPREVDPAHETASA